MVPPFNKPIEEIAAADIERLITDKVREVRSLDYKRALPGRNDASIKELLADVVSFSNAGGGTIIWGIEEERDENGHPTGLPGAVIGVPDNLDAEIRRLENVVRDGTEPRVPGIRFRAVTMNDNLEVLIAHIPRSWAGPHLVKFKNASRFYSRNSAGKYQLDATEIRAAFLNSENQASRVARFRDERVARIVAGEIPGPLLSDEKMVLHVYPASAVDPAFTIDLNAASSQTTHLQPMGASGWDYHFNLDGFLSYAGPSSSGEVRAYTQVFRNGAVEALATSFLTDNRRIPSVAYEKRFIEALDRVRRLYQALGLEPPFFVMPTLVGIRGAQLAVNPMISWDHPQSVSGHRNPRKNDLFGRPRGS